MDITRDITLSWDAPTKRADATPIQGALSYVFEFVAADGTITNFPKVGTPPIVKTSHVVNFAAEGMKAGAYIAHCRAVEEFQGVGRMSARSVGFPFTLETIANPAPPVNLSVK